ncbi:hypothetical protein CBM2609_A20056 [Cupriavidus taiwanensis]|uniref:hypothetical protein n=1 Tax=Cupriavidus taiwanensis TaxID=164546 RepID=UPI000E1385D8|nr:hypothetical protein [Cupriavidus taiwanensis]SOZ14686.1 hypothetical protein CBM2604_A20056 [Cupriavidus taiwanensis]SOZ26395.1 hypothetical protein CBM2609_A20056 [Cupriavidus taiwanensis]SOZ45259.1 hypothetical protein CBM2610_A20045 [Cupriavidus taiwanensis]
MAKNKKGGTRRSKYGSPYIPGRGGSGGPSPRIAAYQAEQQNQGSSPALWIIGACAVVASVAVISSCSDDADDDPGVTVRRASYATLEDCEADWNTPNDCESVPLDDPSTIYSSSLNAPASETAGSGTTHSSSAYYARWYGPYYTANGTVYHPNGTQTQRDMSSGPLRPMHVYDRNGTPTQSFTNATPRAAMVEEATVRRSSLSGGRSMGLTMRSAAVSRAPVVSRGGFTSRFGSSGRSGGG